MKILIWGINYAPEVTGIGPFNTLLCEHLLAAGHDVQMVASFAYYPQWKKTPEDKGVAWRTDMMKGIPVHRCWHYVPSRVSRAKRILHEATFVVSSLLRVLCCKRADVIVAVSPPLMLGPALWIASRFHGARSVFHVQDLQPDAALGVGMLKPGWFTRFLYAVESFSYRKAWRVSGISSGMLAAFSQKGVPVEKQIYFPNGVRLSEPQMPGAFRKKFGFAEEDFLAVYSGNLGVKQGLGILVAASQLIEDPRVKIVICGDGAEKNAIHRMSAHCSNVTLLCLLPEEDYRAMLSDCDVALIPQVAKSGQAFFPSKLLGPLACGRAVLTIADESSQLAVSVAESGCGINVLPDRPAELAAALEKLAGDPDALKTYGAAGRQWVDQFELSRVMDRFINQLTTK